MTDQASAPTPTGWRLAKIGELFESWGGLTPSKANPTYWGPGLPWISSKEVKATRLKASTYTITQKAIDETGLRVCPVGSVLVVVRSGILAHTLPVSVTEVPVTINQDLKAFHSDEPLLNEWLALFLRMSAHSLLASSRRDGTTVQSVQYPLLKNTLIPVPPIEERRYIIEAVEEVLAKQSAALPRLASARRAIERFRRAILAAACTGRLTADWREANQGVLPVLDSGFKRRPKQFRSLEHQDLDEIPDEWCWVQVDDLLPSGGIFDGPFGSHLKTSDYTDAGARVIRLENIGHLRFEDSKRTFVSLEKYKTLHKHSVHPGDIVFSSFIDNQIRVCILPTSLESRALAKADCFTLRPTEAVHRPYLTLQLASPSSYRSLVADVHGATRPRVNTTQVRSLPVPLCSIAEQHEIVRRFEALNALTEGLFTRVDAVSRRLDRTSQAVLAKAFRGDLVGT
jgi:type I restriction enzyme S subunit